MYALSRDKIQVTEDDSQGVIYAVHCYTSRMLTLLVSCFGLMKRKWQFYDKVERNTITAGVRLSSFGPCSVVDD